MPALSTLLVVPLALLFYLSPPDSRLFGAMPTAFIYSILISLLASAWVPCTMCVAQARAPAGQMAVAAAIWSMLSSFIGFGVGPMLVGDLSARLEPLYGGDSIRCALAATAIATAFRALFYTRLAVHLGTGAQAASAVPAAS